MIVVSNASPVINLAVIGQLDLLRQLYGQVLIPQAVYDEVVAIGQPGAVEIEKCDWIKTHQVVNRALVASLELELDRGEAEAIALAIELEADLILLDERKGRTIAAHLGLALIGLLGVLVEARSKGLIPAVQPSLDALISRAGFWISQELYDRVLQVAGE